MAPRLPELFGDFLLLSRLARSHMAETFIAVRLGDRSGRTFVLKRPVLGERRSGRAAQAIAHEGDVLGVVRGAGIVALEATGDLAGLPYVAVEHVRGLPLDVLLAHCGALPAGAVGALARDLARALTTLHAAGYAHGDVAPSNILVDSSGEAVLIDFGLATQIGARRSGVAGKPGYVPPEALRGVAASGAEDVYGWGIVVTECLTGRRLFPERELAEAGARPEAPPAILGLGPWAERVGAALRRDPHARPSAADLVCPALAEADRSVLAALVADVEASDHRTARAPDRPPDGGIAPTLLDAPSPQSDRAPGVGPVAGSDIVVGSLTPTMPMAVVPSRSARSAGGGVSRETARPLATTARTSPSTQRESRRLGPLALAAALAFATGGALGRWSGRARAGAVSVAGVLPRRIALELDGRAFAPSVDGSPQPVVPGRHTLSVRFAKGDAREIPFLVRAGEQVVLVPILRSAEDRP